MLSGYGKRVSNGIYYRRAGTISLGVFFSVCSGSVFILKDYNQEKL